MVIIAMVAYAVYFSWFTILRHQTLNSAHADLGIMHQTAYNTYRAIQTGEAGRFLELTNPHPPGSTNQITRTAIHADLLLVLAAFFYFLYAGPETLLVLQSVALALGAWAVFKISSRVLNSAGRRPWLPTALSLAYLLYPPLHQLNIFDFHAVAFAVPLLLFLFYSLLQKRYGLALVFLILVLLAKEQVSLTVFFIGLYFLITAWRGQSKNRADFWFPLAVMAVSAAWFLVSLYWIIPASRDMVHYALVRYQTLGLSPLGIMAGLFSHPGAILQQLMGVNAGGYILNLLAPLIFLPLLALPQLLLILPELAINLLSTEPLMQSFAFHYAAVLIPGVFIAAIYGARKIQPFTSFQLAAGLVIILAGFTYWQSPLPGLKTWNSYGFFKYADQRESVRMVQQGLKDETLKISATTGLSPWLAGRRYFYLLAATYPAADYVVINKREVDAKADYTAVYERLEKDDNFIKEYDRQDIEVYRRR